MGMKVSTYVDAENFLKNTQVELELNEVANSLILGVCLRLIRYPERVKTPPCLKTVEDENGLVLASMMNPPYKLVVYGHQGVLDEGTMVLVEDLISGGWKVPGVLWSREVVRRVVERWVEITGQRRKIKTSLGYIFIQRFFEPTLFRLFVEIRVYSSTGQPPDSGWMCDDVLLRGETTRGL